MDILSEVHGEDVIDELSDDGQARDVILSGMQFSAQELRDRLDKQRLKLAELNGRAVAMRERRDKLVADVSLAKARQALAPEAIAFLDKLQARLHEDTLGDFRDLTTSIIQDVYPGDNRAEFKLDSRDNVPSLDISLKVNSKDEDIMTMNGGGITNVICTGLRYIALSRTENRNFLALDEPDCWMDVNRVPAFVKVITDVSRVLGTQTLLVSHHPVNLLEVEGVNIIELAPDATGKIVASPLNPQAPSWENDEQEGIRFIELINVGKHEHTVIPLFPGVNALSAENQGGKSTVMAALRFACYNSRPAGDGLIRHDAPDAVVRIGIERGIIIEARVVAEGSPKVTFKLFVPGEDKPRDSQTGERGKPAPDFVGRALRITKVDGLEIQLGMQKEPIFLLNQGGPALAKVLSVGRESGFLTAMRERHRVWTRRDNDLVAKGEAELMGLNRRISVLEELQGIEPLMQLVRKLLDEVESTEKAKLAVSALVVKMQEYEAEIQKMSGKMEVLANLPLAVPVLEPLGPLGRLIDRIAVSEKTANLKVDVTWPVIPTLTDNGLIIDLGRKIGSLEKVVLAGEMLPAAQITPPELTSTAELVKLASSIGRLTKEEAEMARDLKQLESEIALVTSQQDALTESLGGVCPLCGNLMDAHQH